jgi:hypothetical protein
LENDPDIDEYRQRLWDLDRNIEEMEAAPAISPSEKVVKRKELARLRQEWAAVEAAVDARLDKTPSSPAGSVEQASTEPGNGEQPPPARVASDATIAAWMGDEIVYRQKSGGDPRRDAIVLAAKENFPHLTRQRAKRLFTGLDITLKAKRGPKGPRISGQ